MAIKKLFEHNIGSTARQLRLGKSAPDIYPTVFRDEKMFLDILENPHDNYVGIDFEFHNNIPTVVGVARARDSFGWEDDSIAALKWSPMLGEAINAALSKGRVMVAHSGVEADKAVLEAATGVTSPLERWEDSMVAHWLTNMILCKSPAKGEDEGSFGYMDLGTAVSLAVDIPRYKTCRKRYCEGPCPIHDELGYCGLDAWGGLKSYLRNYKGLPREYYRMHIELLDYARVKRERGILVDRDFITAFERASEETKAKLFAHKLHPKTKRVANLLGASGLSIQEFLESPEARLAQITEDDFDREYEKFNPRSPDSVLSYFKDWGLETADKAAIKKLLEKKCEEFGYETAADIGEDDNAPEMLQDLANLALFKGAGKGLAAWFDDKYIGADSRIHPRFIVAGGTSSGRLSSSGPNCFDADTELLTPTGWKRISKLKKWEKVAQWSPNFNHFKNEGTLTFVSPTNYVSYFHKGEMVMFNAIGSYRTTPDHRVPLFTPKKKVRGKREEKIFRDFRADYLPTHNMYYTGGWIDTPEYPGVTDQLLRLAALLGYSGTRGKTLRIDDFGEEVPKDCYVIVAKTEASRIRIEDVLGAAGVTFDRNKAAALREFRYTILVEESLGVVNIPQLIENTSPLNLSARQMRVFLEEVFLWLAEEHEDEICVLNNTQLSNITTMISLSGGSYSISPHPDGGGLIKRMADCVRWVPPNAIKREAAAETVYCVSVPSTYLLTRRFGRTMVMGNCQNIPARGFGEAARRAIIAPPGYVLAKADYSQLELRCILYLAHVDQKKIGQDAFTWLVEQTGEEFFKAAEQYDKPTYEKDKKKAARNIGKITSHSANYGEGATLLSPNELSGKYIRGQIEAGALRVYTPEFVPQLEKPWMFHGSIVAFTGANAAERMYKAKTYENRKKALSISEDIYFKHFWFIREWQMRVLADAEKKQWVETITGRRLKLLGTPHEQFKITLACHGQGVGADHVKDIMRKYYRLGHYPIQVHDELVFELPEAMGDEEIMQHFEIMCGESEFLPGFTVPIEVAVGKNWGQMRKLGRKMYE